MDNEIIKVGYPRYAYKGEIVMCKGIFDLLSYMIDNKCSLSQAAKHYKMAYSKAWKIIAAANKVGRPLLDTSGYIAVVTQEGKDLMEQWRKDVN